MFLRWSYDFHMISYDCSTFLWFSYDVIERLQSVYNDFLIIMGSRTTAGNQITTNDDVPCTERCRNEL